MKKKKRNAKGIKRLLKHRFEEEILLFIMLLIAFPIAVYAKGLQKDTAKELDMNTVYGISVKDTVAEEARTYETKETTTAFVTPIEVYEDPTEAEYENYEEETYSYTDYTTVDADEFTLLCRMVRIECGESEGDEYYRKCYLQTAVALNRLSQGWGETLAEVLLAPGQFYGWGYDTYDWSQVNINIPDLQQAVLDCMEYNDTPENLVYADSRHNHEGTEEMKFYTEIEGQDFYLAK